ncbi:MAG: pyridoxal-dependent decarboxylase [Pseudomonadota bacterium]
MRDLLSDAARRALDYLDSLPERPVAPSAQSVARLEEFERSLPPAGTDAAEVLRELDEIATPASMAMAGPRFFGFVIGGSLPASLAANWLAAAWDQNSGLHAVTPATSTLERLALDWLIELFSLPATTAAGFVTGATVANFTALAAARHAVLRDAGWDVEADGLIGAPVLDVVVSEESHPSVTKSLGMLGLGRNRVIRVPTDARGAMKATALPKLKRPTIICTQIGNVNTGGSDPLHAISDLADAHNAWVHVDGAFGLWLAASPGRRTLIEGYERAHSWATDAHKWLNVPYDSGIAFARDEPALRAAMSITAAYLPHTDTHRNPSDYTPELSRKARGVEVWAALRQLGANGVAELVDRCCDHARRFADGLAAAGFEILAEVSMNQVLVSFGSDAETRAVIEAIQQDGTCWCGITEWQRRTAMRISVCNWSTTDADVERSLAAMLRLAASVGAASSRERR